MKKKTPYDQGSADCWAERDRDLSELNWSPEQVAESITTRAGRLRRSWMTTGETKTVTYTMIMMRI